MAKEIKVKTICKKCDKDFMSHSKLIKIPPAKRAKRIPIFMTCPNCRRSNTKHYNYD